MFNFQVLGDEAPTDSSQNKSIDKKVFSMYVELVETRLDCYIACLYIKILTLVFNFVLLKKTLPHLIWFIVLQELAQDENNTKYLAKTKRAVQGPPQSKQLKIVKASEESTTASDRERHVVDVVMSLKQVSDSGPTSLPQKPLSRRKMSLKKSLQERDKSTETIHKASRSSRSLSEHEFLLKVEPLTLFFSTAHTKSVTIYIFVYSNFRISFLRLYRILWHVEGAYLNGFIVLSTIPGLQRWSLSII